MQKTNIKEYYDDLNEKKKRAVREAFAKFSGITTTQIFYKRMNECTWSDDEIAFWAVQMDKPFISLLNMEYFDHLTDSIRKKLSGIAAPGGKTVAASLGLTK